MTPPRIRDARTAATRLAVALALLVLTGAATPVEQLAEAHREAVKSAARVQELDRAAQTAVDEAARYRARSAALAARVQQAEAVLATAEARAALIDSTIAARRRGLAERQGKIVHLLAALESFSRRPPALALVQPGSVRDTARVALMLDGVLPVIRERTTDLRQELDALHQLKDRANGAQLQLAAARIRLDESRTLLGRLEAERQQRAQGFATASMLESDRALALSVEARDLKDLIGELGSQSRLRDRLASLPGPLPRPAIIPSNALPPPEARLQPAVLPSVAAARLSGFALPALGNVTMGFGELSSAGVRSRGLTLHTRAKAQVNAPAAGRIAYAGPFREYGNIVIIEHGEGMTSLVAGLDALDARVGQRIAAGGPLGRMGAERRDLTLEVRRNGEPVDPLPLVAEN